MQEKFCSPLKAGNPLIVPMDPMLSDPEDHVFTAVQQVGGLLRV